MPENLLAEVTGAGGAGGAGAGAGIAAGIEDGVDMILNSWRLSSQMSGAETARD
jgi:hypothetical protein